MPNENTDVFIIGGGINGVAIAAEAASRGLSVTLCEKNDLAAATSSASSKLIHGGLRYLEQYDFKLVRDALKEREILLKRAAHLIHPLQFILPYQNNLRNPWVIRAGLFIYDHLTKSSLPRSSRVTFNDAYDLQNKFKFGFSYYDAFTNDSRLVIANAQEAKLYGADIRNYSCVLRCEYRNNLWHITCRENGREYEFTTRFLINASGPWISEVNNLINAIDKINVRYVKGSHIVVPKLYSGKRAYTLQNKDKRIIFAIPYYDNFTLIGTTDIELDNVISDVTISDTEIEYLCDCINQYFTKKITPADVIWTYSGIRCLLAEKNTSPQDITRDYKFITNANLPLTTIISGKITTHRILACKVVDSIQNIFSHLKISKSDSTPLPGSNFANGNVQEFYNQCRNKYSWMPENLLDRYIANYGTHVEKILKGKKSFEDLGNYFGYDLYESEVRYLIDHEWAKTTEDIIWLRTKIALGLSQAELIILENKLGTYLQSIQVQDSSSLHSSE